MQKSGTNVVEIEGPIVLLHGTLTAADRQSECEMLARKHPLPGLDSSGLRRYRYTQCAVLHAPFDLPDGEYVVTTEDGHIIPATRVHGLWLLGPAEAPAAERREPA